jgi:hypothetical protein
MRDLRKRAGVKKQNWQKVVRVAKVENDLLEHRHLVSPVAVAVAVDG